MELFESLMNLSLSDIKAARLLYSNKQYRNSVFLFQQAVEKASKALGIAVGDLKHQKDLKGIGHKPLSMYFNAIKKHEQRLKTSTIAYKNEDHTNELLMLFSSIPQLYANASKFIDELNKKQFTNVTTKELKFYLSTIEDVEKLHLQLPQNFEDEVSPYIKLLEDWIQLLNFEEAQKKELLTLTNHKEHYALVFHLLSEVFKTLPFILITFIISSIITTEHAVLTRYPEKNNDPSKLYKKSMPLVKLLPDFMNYFDSASKKLLLLNNTINQA